MCEASETHDMGESAPGTLTDAEDASEESQAPLGQDPAVIEIDPEFGLAFGDWSQTGIDVTPLTGLNKEHDKDLLDKISIAAGIGNTSVQVLQGVANVQGLVRLAPETVAKLQVLKPMTSGGLNLGALTDGGGKVAHLIRWTPAFGAQAVSLLAAMGPAAALFAIQLQLSSLSHRIDKTSRLVEEILQKIDQNAYEDIQACERIIQEILHETLKTERVNLRDWERIAPFEEKLRSAYGKLKCELGKCLSALKDDAQGGKKFLEERAGKIENDAAYLVVSLFSWIRYRILYIQVRKQGVESPKDEEGVNFQINTTSEKWKKLSSEVLNLLEELECAANLCCLRECGYKFSEKVVKGAQSLASMVTGNKGRSETSTPRDIERIERLAQRLSDLREFLQPRPEPRRPDVAAYALEEVLERDVKILRWVLPDCYDQLRVLAEVDTSGRKNKSGSALLGVTADFFFCVPQKEIREKGIVGRLVPLCDIRYVRVKGERGFDVITKDENFSISFGEWLQESEKSDEPRKIGRHLASFANLPDEERGEELPISNVSQKSGRNELER